MVKTFFILILGIAIIGFHFYTDVITPVMFMKNGAEFQSVVSRTYRESYTFRCGKSGQRCKGTRDFVEVDHLGRKLDIQFYSTEQEIPRIGEKVIYYTNENSDGTTFTRLKNDPPTIIGFVKMRFSELVLFFILILVQFFSARFVKKKETSGVISPEALDKLESKKAS